MAATEITADQADDHADDGRDKDDAYPYHQGDPGAGDDPAQNVPADLVRAQKMVGGRRPKPDHGSYFRGVVRHQIIGEYTGYNQEHDNGQADQGKRIVIEMTKKSLHGSNQSSLICGLTTEIENVNHEIEKGVKQGAQNGEAHDGLKVQVQDGAHHVPSHARPGKNGFGQDRAGQKLTEKHAGNGQNGQD